MQTCAYKAPTFDYACDSKVLPGEQMCFWHIPKDNGERVNIYYQNLENGKKPEEALRKFSKKRLVGFQMPEIELKESNFFQFNFNLANLVRSDLSRAFLRETQFVRVFAYKGCFEKANFNRSVLNDSQWGAASFREAYLNECEIKRCDLSHVNFEFAQVRQSFLDESWGEQLKIEEANFTETSFASVNFKGLSCRLSQLLNAKFPGACITNSIFIESDLIGAQFSNALFSNTQFFGVDMRHSEIKTSTFKACEFREVDFTGAQFENSVFDNCHFFKCKQLVLTEVSGSTIHSQ